MNTPWTHFREHLLSAQYVPDAGLLGEDGESVQWERQTCHVPSTPSKIRALTHQQGGFISQDSCWPGPGPVDVDLPPAL